MANADFNIVFKVHDRFPYASKEEDRYDALWLVDTLHGIHKRAHALASMAALYDAHSDEVSPGTLLGTMQALEREIEDAQTAVEGFYHKWRAELHPEDYLPSTLTPSAI